MPDMFPTHRHVIRFSLEAVTPISVASGMPGDLFDMALIRDANGLPTVPGPAIAGVLKALFVRYHTKSEAERLFGYERERSQDGQASRAEFSWGHVQNSRGKPIEGILLGDARSALEDDEVLSLLATDAPIKRDQVAIGHTGAAEQGLKFDRVAVPSGCRFNFEIGMWGHEDQLAIEKELLRRLLGLIEAPEFRLGGSTRRGFGRLAFPRSKAPQRNGENKAAVSYACFDLRCPQDRNAFCRYRGLPIDKAPGDLGFVPLELDISAIEKAGRAVAGMLLLKPAEPWRIGSGVPLDGSSADAAPISEPRVLWSLRDGQPSADVTRMIVVPGSAIKGVLAHRMSFHLNRIRNTFADKLSDGEWTEVCRDRGIDSLFGNVDKAQGGSNDGAGSEGGNRAHAGCVFIDDSFLPFEDAQFVMDDLTHNSIDRFSGGARSGKLFTEQVIFGGEFAIPITILVKNGEGAPLREEDRRAFLMALNDLCEERLAIGANGYGYCRGKVDWADDGQWCTHITF